MPHRNPANYVPVAEIMMVLLSALGGTASYLRKLRHGYTRKFSIIELAMEVVISVFVGTVTLLICDSQEIDKMMTGAIVGLSGHMGSRAIYFIEMFLKNKFGIDLNSMEHNKRSSDK